MSLNSFLVKKFQDLTGKGDIKRLAKKTPFEGITVVSDIPYIDDGNKFHLLDVYYPEKIDENKKLPIIIDIHGGAWIYGTKDINKHYCMGLAAHGFIVVNASYRLIAEGCDGEFPKILADVFDAFNWVEKNIEKYNGDLNNVFLTGDSAGAHLAALAQCVLSTEEFAKKLSFSTNLKFNALALTCGVSDLEKFSKIKLPIIKYFHKIFLGEGYKTSDYLKHLTIRNNNVEAFPPVILNTADGDFMKSDVLCFYDTLKNRSKNEVELIYIKKNEQIHKLHHVYNVLFPEYEESIKTNDAIAAFFKKYMK